MKLIRKYIKHIVITMLLLILPSNYGIAFNQTPHLSKDSTKNPFKYHPVALKNKNDTLICLTNQEAHRAALELKQIPKLKNIIKEYDTILKTKDQIILRKDSLILIKDNYTNQIDSLYDKLYSSNEEIKSKYQKTKRNSFFKSLGIITLIIIFTIYH